jgi:hypothetical protein
MVFIGRVAYLLLFPGALFIIIAGLVARAVTSTVGVAVAGRQRTAPEFSGGRIILAARTESIAAGGGLHAVTWLAPVVKAVALSWASCMLMGFLRGDLALLFALLLAAAGTDVAAAYLSPNPRTRQGAWPEAASLIAWAVPAAIVFSCVALRTHQVSLPGIISWQALHGTPLAANQGGILEDVGAALALVALFVATLSLARLKPLGRPSLGGTGGLLDDVSGPPLAAWLGASAAMLFVAPLTVVVLFFAGPSATWYQVVFWALKVAGVLILLGLTDVLASRASARRVLLWGAGAAGIVALAGLILTWIGLGVS